MTRSLASAFPRRHTREMDSEDSPVDDQLEWAAALVRLIPDHFPGHPAVDWYVGITNGIPEPGLPASGLFHRFRQAKHTAYLWVEDGVVFLCPWHSEGRYGRIVHR